MRLGRQVLVAGVVVLVQAVAAPVSPAATRCGQHPWCDATLPPVTRAALVVSELTPQERIGLLAGDRAFGVAGLESDHSAVADGVPRLDVPSLTMTDGPLGVRQGPGTGYPSSMSMAASFDRRMATLAGDGTGNETRLRGNDILQGPTVNLLRTPLWGRAFETYGEDPMLTSAMGVAWIKAAERQGVIATVKHFAANNQEGVGRRGRGVEGSRFSVDVRVDERTQRELYLPAFEAAVRDAKVGIVMCSYNRINGTHACEKKGLLTTLLRQEWGFRGFVLSDYGASKQIGRSLASGMDFDPFPFAAQDGGQAATPSNVATALKRGETTMAAVDTAVRRVLTTMFARGLFDRPGPVDQPGLIDRAAHDQTAKRIAEAGMVLLRNEKALPLDSRRMRSLAVIGADGDRYARGGGSAGVDPGPIETPRAAITRRAGPRVAVRYDDGRDPARAAATARGADAAVVVVGDRAGEGGDKPCLRLDCGSGDGLRRDALIERVAAANRRTIVVLETAGPVLTPWRNRVAGILEAWYPGQAGGDAIARTLFGDVDPGGRLPATFPASVADLPTGRDPRRYPGVRNTVTYGERLLVGYRWFDQRRLRPAYEFGAGLSYTSFSVGRPIVQPTGRGPKAQVVVAARNTGRRRGAFVAQVYVAVPATPGLPQPPRQLRGFAKASIEPGRRVVLRVELNARAFATWDPRRHRWIVPRGCYDVWAAQSSRTLGEPATAAVGGARCRQGAVRLR